MKRRVYQKGYREKAKLGMLSPEVCQKMKERNDRRLVKMKVKHIETVLDPTESEINSDGVEEFPKNMDYEEAYRELEATHLATLTSLSEALKEILELKAFIAAHEYDFEGEDEKILKQLLRKERLTANEKLQAQTRAHISQHKRGLEIDKNYEKVESD